MLPSQCTLATLGACLPFCPSFSSPYFLCHCHSISTGKKCLRLNSGHRQSRNTNCVSSWHCHNMKSLSRFTPLVLISRSSGGSPAVKRCDSIVAVLMLSGSG